MDDVSKVVSDHGTQLVLIGRDIKQLSDSFSSIMSKLDEIKTHERTVSNLQTILDSYERRLSILEREYSEFRTVSINIQSDLNTRMQAIKEGAREAQYTSSENIIKKLDDMSDKIDKKFGEKEDRIRKLEDFRWYAVGIMFALAFLLSGIPWKVVFSN